MPRDGGREGHDDGGNGPDGVDVFSLLLLLRERER